MKMVQVLLDETTGRMEVNANNVTDSHDTLEMLTAGLATVLKTMRAQAEGEPKPEPPRILVPVSGPRRKQ